MVEEFIICLISGLGLSIITYCCITFYGFNMFPKRKRSIEGSAHWNARLTEIKVIAIKKDIAEGLSNRAIAKKYNATHNCISKIRCGRTWRHVEIEPKKINLLDYLK
jgi:hypothetical protein